MAHSKWKTKYIFSNFYKHFFLFTLGKKSRINAIYNRSAIVSKILIKKCVEIHKGKELLNLTFNKYMVGYKMGELAFTRKNYKFPSKKKKKKKK